MKCVLCLVVCLAATIYSYPQQRVTVLGLPWNGRPLFDIGAYEPKTSVFGDDSEEGSVIGGKESVPTAYDPSEINPYYYQNGFGEIMTAMHEMLNNLRQEMNEILRRIPENKGSEEGEAVIPFGSPEVDLSNAKNESTSKTEVIDGQVYTVNETVIRSGDEGFGSIFRVKTIQIRPTDSTETGAPQEPKSKETPESKESAPSAETTARPLSSESPELVPSNNDDKNEIEPVKIPSTELEPPEIEEIPSVEINEIDTSNEVDILEPTGENNPVQYRDLSRDTLVNQYLSDQQLSQGLVLMNPDAEFIDVDKSGQKYKDDYYRYESQTPVRPQKFEKLTDASK